MDNITERIKKILCGQNHTMVLLESQKLLTWGDEETLKIYYIKFKSITNQQNILIILILLIWLEENIIQLHQILKGIYILLVDMMMDNLDQEKKLMNNQKNEHKNNQKKKYNHKNQMKQIKKRQARKINSKGNSLKSKSLIKLLISQKYNLFILLCILILLSLNKVEYSLGEMVKVLYQVLEMRIPNSNLKIHVIDYTSTDLNYNTQKVDESIIKIQDQNTKNKKLRKSNNRDMSKERSLSIKISVQKFEESIIPVKDLKIY
ncbi:unnamed protein product [Paramecium primaurelia]|uniref:Transmembrane protein n=1 Tax=Paramecium primaurelia TaxID=5886 RepID=A0A8S1KB86_PARPR|nr:unnamed protein product [Paramecium primaurelia]